MFIESISLALALAMDAFAVSVTSGIKLDHVGKREIFRISWHFGLFQFLFFASGFFVGSGVSGFISKWADIIAFGILFFIGSHMVYEALCGQEDEESRTNPTRGKTLVLLSVATSIDAMAAGFGISLVKSEIAFTSFAVFIVTLSLCGFGIIMGDRISNAGMVRGISEVSGGIILILLGFKFLFS